MSAQVNRAELEGKVKAMYRDVAENPHGEFHFEMGRALAERFLDETCRMVAWKRAGWALLLGFIALVVTLLGWLLYRSYRGRQRAGHLEEREAHDKGRGNGPEQQGGRRAPAPHSSFARASCSGRAAMSCSISTARTRALTCR